MTAKGFFAYPGSNPLVTSSIREAVELSKGSELEITAWEKLAIIGFKLDNLIREKILEKDVLIADITYANPNVFYEIGYAIGVQKPVLPVINISIDKALYRVQRLGLFDTLGIATYHNAEELIYKLSGWESSAWVRQYIKSRNYSQPLFILDTLVKIDFRNHIFHAVENSKLNFRSFDPAEVPRLTASQAISDVTSSAGVIIPILSSDVVDSEPHNLRASFVLGLCHGFSVEVLAIQFANSPVPLDYRDFIRNSTYKFETEKHVAEFASDVLIWNQKQPSRDRRISLGVLNKIDLGSPTAENETQKLNEYFIETAEYARALRAEGSIVTGRKGSGKSAIYFQMRDRYAREPHNCVVELRPASHNLSEMREAILNIVSAGIFDHTVASFWQYIIYFEVMLKIREIVLPKSKNNFALQERIRAIEEKFKLDDAVVSADFTSRLDDSVRRVVDALDRHDSGSDIKASITNSMFEVHIPKLREAIVSFSDYYDNVIILIDDLDKGWPPRQVEAADISMIKHLIETLGKIRNDLGRRRLEVRHTVFIRSDIYERLVEDTSDRGKYNVIRVDWSDPKQLEYMIKQRALSSLLEEDHADAWDSINPVLPDGKEAYLHLIEGSLRRPRFLIDLYERTLSVAINRGHVHVTSEDIDEGLRQMSLYLVSDFGYEMRDVAGTPEDIFYLFIGASDILTTDELIDVLLKSKMKLSIEKTVEILLWYGFLGISDNSGNRIFIYDREYDFRRLENERMSLGEDLLYVLNPAFLRGLS
ncbi:hypothetical protein AAFN86_01250 [Roseomonas sp. CAU 1739]|uniref:P-loop ATPase, Sll1717 family n=1 Tax=Roseomonas sp. CAU 1739 TaxID=3140364 RepID=UPI00325B8A27